MNLRYQKGIAAIELTILLPVMLLLVYAIAEFGRVLHQYNMLTQLTRDAGRYVSLGKNREGEGSTGVVILNAQTKANTKNILLYGNETGGMTPLLSGLSAADISIDQVGTGIIVISVSYNWTPIMGDSMATFGFGNDIDLNFNLVTEFAVRAI